MKQTGPVLFSYGFRPFFLGAGIWTVIAMLLWLLAISGHITVGGEYGAVQWHAHEMLFGFAPAVLVGFLLTTVANWSGHLPVAGRPLMAFFALWCAGRLAMLLAGLTAPVVAAVIDAAFLPAFLLVCAREIVAGRKWKDAKPVVALLTLTAANMGFHWSVLEDRDPALFVRLALSTYLVLITLVGGRMIPSVTRNFFNQRGRLPFPAPHGRFDQFAIGSGLLAFIGWTAFPQGHGTTTLAFAAGLIHLLRLGRWRGLAVADEPLLVALHVAYAFVPLGLFAVAAGALELLPVASVLHILSVGALAGMMLAVMIRSTRGHTGRIPRNPTVTNISCAALFLAALLRPLADIFPGAMAPLLTIAGGLWIAAFLLFILEYGPTLAKVRRAPRG